MATSRQAMGAHDVGTAPVIPLPVELWIWILQLAAARHPTHPPSSSYEDLRSFALTSRSWASIAQPLLFESVSVSNGIQATALVSALEGNRSLAREVLSLDLRSYVGQGDEDRVGEELAGRILRECRSLRRLVLWRVQVAVSCLSHVASTLESLQIREASSPNQLLGTIPRLPILQHLKLDSLRCAKDRMLPTSFPKLSSLELVDTRPGLDEDVYSSMVTCLQPPSLQILSTRSTPFTIDSPSSLVALRVDLLHLSTPLSIAHPSLQLLFIDTRDRGSAYTSLQALSGSPLPLTLREVWLPGSLGRPSGPGLAGQMMRDTGEMPRLVDALERACERQGVVLRFDGESGFGPSGREAFFTCAREMFRVMGRSAWT